MLFFVKKVNKKKNEIENVVIHIRMFHRKRPEKSGRFLVL